jgi:hypothetical protein
MRFMNGSDDLQRNPGQSGIADGRAGAERQIDDAAGDVRAAVVDRDGDASSIGASAANQDHRAEWQRPMSRGEAPWVVWRARRGTDLMVLAAVAACDARCRRRQTLGRRAGHAEAKQNRGEKSSHPIPLRFVCA